MSTYRERRLAKANRLDEWSAQRQAKAAEQHARNQPAYDALKVSQPMDGRTSKRVNRSLDRERENAEKAQEMAKRAEGIRAAADNAIYSDDHDAVERLRERIAELEAERDQMKQANAAFKKTHKAELKELTPYGRDRALPFPSFKLTNLGATIRRNKQRLAELEGNQ